MVDVTSSGTLEQWRSAVESRHVIRRVTLNGFKDDLVPGGSDFYLTPEERVLNQTACKPEYDPFSNGAFERVVLVENTDDVHRFQPSPNTITQSEIDEIVGDMHWKTAEKRLAEIDSPVALNRILSAALESDTGAKRLSQIRGRLSEVAPGQVQPSAEAVSTVQAFDPPQQPQEASIHPQAPQTLGADGRAVHGEVKVPADVS